MSGLARDVGASEDHTSSVRWLALRREGERLRARGEFHPAEPLLRESVDLTELDGGAGALELAASLNALGLLCKDLARYDEASALYERALSLLSSERPSRATARALATLYHNLGGIEHAREALAVGEALARRGVDVRGSMGDAGDADLAADLSALAAIVEGRGRFDEAESLYRDALALLERAAVQDQLEIAVTLAGLGVLEVRRGATDRAIAPLTRAAALKREALGDRHPDLAITLNNLAFAHERLGDAARAESLFREAYDICASALGAEHPRTRACRDNLERLHDLHRRTSMDEQSTPSVVRIDLTEKQRAQVRAATDREADAIELTVVELEARIAPRLASNHNECVLRE